MLFSYKNIFQNFKFLPLGPVLFLAFFSLLTLASFSSGDKSPLLIFEKQALWYLLGFALFFLISKYFNPGFFCKRNFFAVGFYIFSLFLLVLVLLVGARARGTAGWFDFSFFRFQPAELAKLALLIILARYFANWHIEIWRWGRWLISLAYAGVPFFLVFLQPDLGSAAVFLILWLAILLASGLKAKHFLIFLIIGLLLGALGWNYVLAPYQKSRITSFLDPHSDPLGAGYNVIQSEIAIGSGGFWGKGLGKGIETQLKFLPEAKTDFFLAGFIEEWGLLGGIILILCFAFLVFSLTKISLRQTDNFSYLFIFGYLVILISQIIINFGANLGFLPVTGLPLPFLSYGGSNLLLHFACLGIINSFRLKN